MATLRFHIVPNAKANCVAGTHGDAIKIKLKARPIEGEANAALCRFLADKLGLPERAVTIQHGKKSRDKLVHVEVMEEESIREKLRN